MALSKQFALALTLYSVAMNLLLYYVRVPWYGTRSTLLTAKPHALSTARRLVCWLWQCCTSSLACPCEALAVVLTYLHACSCTEGGASRTSAHLRRVSKHVLMCAMWLGQARRVTVVRQCLKPADVVGVC